MAENRVQHNLIMAFGQKYPHLRKNLYEVHQNHKHRSLGMVPGVSDLHFINPHNGVLTGIELKAKKKTHDCDHVLRQINWGRNLITAGGNFLLTTDYKLAMAYVSARIEENNILAEEIQKVNAEYINNVVMPRLKSHKTITF